MIRTTITTGALLWVAAIMGCVSIDEPVQDPSPFAIVHVQERLEVEGVSLGSNVIVDVVRRSDGLKQPPSLLESLNPEILSVNLVGSELALRGLKVGSATLMVGEQAITVVVAEPVRVELLWPGSTLGKMKSSYVWTDGPEALVVLRDAQERRLWGLTEKIEVEFTTTTGGWRIAPQRVVFENFIGVTINNRELRVKVGELSSETLYFMINKNTRPSKLEIVADGNGAWVVAKDEGGRILITTAWSEPKLESDCARLIVRDPADVMTDYYGGDLPAHPGLFRLQRKRPGRALGDCKVSFSVVPEGSAEALVIEEIIKL